MGKMSKNYAIYCDGAYHPNIKKGGWSYVTLLEGDIIDQKSGFMFVTTSNRMEIFPAIQAIKNLEYEKGDTIMVFSDSQYLVKTMSKGWKRKKNNDLWEFLDEVCCGKDIQWVWVKGHSGNKYNEICDSEANRQAESVAV